MTLTNLDKSDPPRVLIPFRPVSGAELRHIKGVTRKSPSVRTTTLEPSLGAVEEVLSLMKEADWVHLACHRTLDSESPTESRLCLADGQCLTLSVV